uniref:Heparinase n=1 Tax=Schlesneria paludicola TaxID=360056 RepID=A0A7C4LL45_9PLAN
MTNLISIHHSAESDGSLSAADLLRGLAWNRTAPDELVEAAGRGDPVRFSRLWRQRLRDRLAMARTATRELLSGWSAAPPADEGLLRLMAGLQRASRRRRHKQRPAIKPPTPWNVRVHPLLKALTASGAPLLATPLGLLAALELLITTNSSLSQRQWWSLWSATLKAAWQRLAAASPPAELASAAAAAEQTPDQRLLEEGELPFLVGLYFADLSGSARLMQRGRRYLKRDMIARTDTDGTPHSELLSRLPLWIAPLVRSTVWSRRWRAFLWTEDEQRRLSAIAEWAVALCRGDGRFALTNGLPVAPLPVLRKAAELFGWSPRNSSLAALRLLERQVGGTNVPTRPRAGGIRVMPSGQSDWARLAVLRTNWSPAADGVALAHHERLPRVEITAAGTVILQGTWELSLRVNDAPVELADEWSCVCWESDPDGDYAELQMLGPEGMRVERLVFLSRQDRLLLLADAVSHAPQGVWQVTARLPLAPGVAAEPETASRSLRLRAGRVRGRVFPLALPQSRVVSTPHRCAIEDGQLVLHQMAQGTGLLAPLVFVWDERHQRPAAEWRTLTVTENCRIVKGDVAAGYRLRLGDDQWLFYRSLKRARMARAVLGHHTPHETVVARFTPQGDAEPLLMIEAS